MQDARVAPIRAFKDTLIRSFFLSGAIPDKSRVTTPYPRQFVDTSGRANPHLRPA